MQSQHELDSSGNNFVSGKLSFQWQLHYRIDELKSRLGTVNIGLTPKQLNFK